MRSFFLFPLIFVLLSPQSLLGHEAFPVTVREQNHMSTYVTITVARQTTPEVEEAIDAAYTEIIRLEKLLSEWKSDSQISEVNRQAGIKAVKVDPELFTVSELAYQVSKTSAGAFDISFAALAGLWNFKTKSPKLPASSEIDRRIGLVDYRWVKLNPVNRTIFLEKKGMRIGLGGVAKGYMVDRASLILRKRGFPNHLIIAGGDLYASGTRGDRKWRIGIRHPKEGIYGTFEAQDEGVATSGTYERFFYLDSVRYHHLIDPRTGWPARGVSGVTVVAKNAALADAYATALVIVGVKKGMKLAAQVGLEALFFNDQYQTTTTPRLKTRIQVSD